MPETVESLVLAVCVLATSIWVGGYVAIVVVARTAGATLDPGARVAFFRALGRSYLRVALPALIIALISGGVLASDHDGDATLVATVVVTLVLLVSFAVAVVQARRMTVLRRSMLSSPDDAQLSERVRRGARAAALLRAGLGLLSVALVVLGAFLAV